MKNGLEIGFVIGLGIILGIIVVSFGLRMAGLFLTKLGSWIEKRSLSKASPEERAAAACRKMAKYYEHHR